MKIIFLILAFYFLHWYLVYKTNLSKKIKWLSPLSFRYFWNVALFLSFLPTVTTGILLYLGYTSRFVVDLHNQIGIIMMIVGLLHLGERINYFLKSF